MSRKYRLALLTTLLALGLTLAGCASNAPESQQASGEQPSKSGGVVGKLFESSRPVTLPEGTVLSVTLDQSLNSAQSRSGDEFDASLSAPVVLDGKTVIPQGAKVRGRVLDARSSGRLEHPGYLRIALHSIEVNGKAHDIRTSSIARQGQSHKKRNIEMIGGGAAAGAVIGGIVGGGKGAAIGAAAGAGGGTATAAATGKKDITIPAETHLSFRLEQPLTVQVKS